MSTTDWRTAPRFAPLAQSAESRGVSRDALGWILVFPYALTLAVTVFLTFPPTRDFTTSMLQENRPVELGTTVFFLIAAWLAGRLALQRRRAGAPVYVVAFFAFFAVAAFLVAMEEIAWGQWLLGFDTPDAIAEVNRQGELTIHNVEGFHGRTEFLRVTFGIGGLIGIALRNRPFFRPITPALFLIGWFALITVLAIPDLGADLLGLDGSVIALIDYLSELNELLVSMVSVLFIRYIAPMEE